MRQKRILFFTSLFLVVFSLMVSAVYVPTVDTVWGDFIEKTTKTVLVDGDKNYDFTILSKKHTFKATFAKSDPNSPLSSTSIAFFVDGQKIGSAEGSLSSTAAIDGVDLTFSVPQESTSGYYYADKGGKGISLRITTGGAKSSLLVSKFNPNLDLTFPFKNTYTMTVGNAIQFYVDDAPFSLLYHSKTSDGQHLFIAAFEHLSSANVVTAPAKGNLYVAENNVYIKKEMVDNFWNKYVLSLKIGKYEVINGIPLVTFSLFGKHEVSAEVINSFQGMTNEVWGPLDFSNSAVSQTETYGNSQNGLSPKIYGPMQVGAEKYYVAQVQDSITSSVKVYVKRGRFVWKDDILGPVDLKKPLIGTPTSSPSVGPAMSVLLTGSAGKIYFVPVDFKFEPTTVYPYGRVDFFVGGENAFKLFSPQVSVVDVAVSPDLGVPGVGLPGQQVPPSAEGRPGGLPPAVGGLAGDLNGDGSVNKLDVEWIKDNPDKMWNNKLKKDIYALAGLVKAMINNWSSS